MTTLITRLAGEVAVLAMAIAVAVGVALAIAPENFPPEDSPNFIAESQRFYNRLFVAQLAVLAAGIIAYCLLRTLYQRWRAPDIVGDAY